MLFLGTSETVGEFGEQFSVLDRLAKLYQRHEDIHGKQRAARGRLLAPATPFPRVAGRTVAPVKLPLRELTEQALFQHVALAGALVNRKGDILYLHGRTGMYLELAAGEVGINNILKLAREGLRRELTTALHKAADAQEIVRRPALRVKTNGHFTTVDLTIRPVPTVAGATPATLLYLVILEEASSGEAVPDECAPLSAIDDAALADSAGMAALKLELKAQAECLQTANEELETSNQNLESLNEEMQSVNEELQSTNEELETSKEELQSINEELSTVNAELQSNVLDLSRANNDMNNLLAGTGVGTVFVDHQLRILRFTPEARAIIHLIPSDEGRPVSHLVSNLVGYRRLADDVQAVLDTLVPLEVEVQTVTGKWYTMRIQPYRTVDNVIEGAVIAFLDITAIVETREALQKANASQRLAVVVRDAHDAITVQDLDGRILAWNPGAERLYGWTEAEALSMNVRDRIPAGQRAEALTQLHRLSPTEMPEPFRTQRLNRAAAVVDVWLTATALVNEAGQMYAIATTERAMVAKN